MNRIKHRAGRILCVGLCTLVLLALAACASPASILQGSYQATISEEEIPTSFGMTNLTPDDIGLFVGEWQINFLADGIFTVTKEGQTMIEEGHYSVDGDRLTVGQETGPASCVGPPDRVAEPGVYRWSRQAGQVVFLPVNEKCGGRLIAFSAMPWTRVEK